MRQVRRETWAAEQKKLSERKDKEGGHTSSADWMDEQVEELLYGAENIAFVSDAENANAKQALKVTKQCYAVSSFYAERSKRERASASGVPLSNLEGIHNMADRIASGFGESGTTLRRWYAEWDSKGCFQLDQRGTTSAISLVGEEEVKTAMQTEMIKQVKKKGKDSICVDSMHVYINDVLLPGLDPALKKLYGLSEGHRIARTTAYEWMKACGGVATWFAPVLVVASTL